MSSLAHRLGWDDLKLVLAISEAGSLAGAAARLAVNPSTIFRRLRQMEIQLSAPLFLRHRKRYELTVAGRAIVELAYRIGEDIDGVVQNLSEETGTAKGELKLTTNDTLLFHVLMPMLAAFSLHRPNVKIKITVENSQLNLSTSDSDVALRATDHPPEHLAGRRLGRTDWGLYARSSDFSDTNEPKGLKVFECKWVTLCDNLSSLHPVKFVERNVPPERIVFCVNSVLALADAIEAGFGIGYIPFFVGDSRSALRRLEGPPMLFGHQLWLLFHPDMRRSIVVREFVDFVTVQFGACAAIGE